MRRADACEGVRDRDTSASEPPGFAADACRLITRDMEALCLDDDVLLPLIVRARRSLPEVVADSEKTPPGPGVALRYVCLTGVRASPRSALTLAAGDAAGVLCESDEAGRCPTGVLTSLACPGRSAVVLLVGRSGCLAEGVFAGDGDACDDFIATAWAPLLDWDGCLLVSGAFCACRLVDGTVAFGTTPDAVLLTLRIEPTEAREVSFCLVALPVVEGVAVVVVDATALEAGMEGCRVDAVRLRMLSVELAVLVVLTRDGDVAGSAGTTLLDGLAGDMVGPGPVALRAFGVVSVLTVSSVERCPWTTDVRAALRFSTDARKSMGPSSRSASASALPATASAGPDVA